MKKNYGCTSGEVQDGYRTNRDNDFNSMDFAKESTEEKQARTEQWRGSLRQIILCDLDYFHKQRWNRIHAELFHKINAAPDEETKAPLEAEMDAHYKLRFYPETSREALLDEVDSRELPPPGL